MTNNTGQANERGKLIFFR